MALLPRPPHIGLETTDKFQHMLAFSTLALLAGLAWPRASIAKIFAWLALFGALIEIAQLVPALHRDGDVWDWFADIFAVAAMLAIVSVWRRFALNRPI